MREEHSYAHPLFHFVGITPACAGRTEVEFILSLSSQDHPRVCGKNVAIFLLRVELTGSPPRVREELLFSLVM